MLILFSLGLCLPLIICGIFSARTMQLLNSHTGQKLVLVMRKLAALVIAVLGIYFTLHPFWGVK